LGVEVVLTQNTNDHPFYERIYCFCTSLIYMDPKLIPGIFIKHRAILDNFLGI